MMANWVQIDYIGQKVQNYLKLWPVFTQFYPFCLNLDYLRLDGEDGYHPWVPIVRVLVLIPYVVRLLFWLPFWLLFWFLFWHSRPNYLKECHKPIVVIHCKHFYWVLDKIMFSCGYIKKLPFFVSYFDSGPTWPMIYLRWLEYKRSEGMNGHYHLSYHNSLMI